MERVIQKRDFHCPKCGKVKIIMVEIDEHDSFNRVAQFDFACECGCRFKYQYRNVSHNGEMSTYKNPYTEKILQQIEERIPCVERRRKTLASH